MEVRFYNTYSRQKESFAPLREGEVRIYTCGPTVYDYATIGNFRTFLFEDLLRRALQRFGYRVVQVMNLTDVDDKIIHAALTRNVPLETITAPFIQAFFEDLGALNVEPAEYYPRATEHIPQMLRLIGVLLEKGCAYRLGGSVYFDISKFPAYGNLSRIKASSSRDFSRLESDEYEKEQISDFALWKERKEGEPFWESPFGPGRPGWHIECSAMSMQYLGETLDIHTGGIDNMFPHHENEIAQSESATGKTFVRTWLHSSHLMVNGERMAKSKGNYYTLRDLVAKGFSPRAIRFLLTSTHYRTPLNFTFDSLVQAEKHVERIQDFFHRLLEYQGNPEDRPELPGILHQREKELLDSLADDLNVSGAHSALFSLMRDINPWLLSGSLSRNDVQSVLGVLRSFDRVLGLLEEKGEAEEWILALITERDQARKQRDFSRSDQIREQLLQQGIVLEDTAQGTRWRKK
jgi:cysteinyl-tRNA synthetase